MLVAFTLKSTCLVLAGELLVRDVCRQVGVEHSTEGQAIVPAAAEVGDINVLKDTARIHFYFDSTPRNIYNQSKIDQKPISESEIRESNILSCRWMSLPATVQLSTSLQTILWSR